MSVSVAEYFAVYFWEHDSRNFDCRKSVKYTSDMSSWGFRIQLALIALLEGEL